MTAAVVRRGLILFTSLISVGCIDYLNPRPDQKKFEGERLASAGATPKLTAAGELKYDLATGPDAAGAEEVVRDAKDLYAQLCASCHGAAGAGDGAAAAAMNPKPRSFVDKAWQAEVDDARIAKVIAQGGPSVGLSPMMAPWGSMVNAKEVDGLVQLIRGYTK